MALGGIELETLVSEPDALATRLELLSFGIDLILKTFLPVQHNPMLFSFTKLL